MRNWYGRYKLYDIIWTNVKDFLITYSPNTPASNGGTVPIWCEIATRWSPYLSIVSLYEIFSIYNQKYFFRWSTRLMYNGVEFIPFIISSNWFKAISGYAVRWFSWSIRIFLMGNKSHHTIWPILYEPYYICILFMLNGSLKTCLNTAVQRILCHLLTNFWLYHEMKL